MPGRGGRRRRHRATRAGAITVRPRRRAGAGVLMIVNGPIAAIARLQLGRQPLRPGLACQRHRRAAPCAWSCATLIGTLPGSLDRGTLGHPGASYGYVIAENEAESPWTPLHVERGFRPGAERGDRHGGRWRPPVLQPAPNTAAGVLTTVLRRHEDTRHDAASPTTAVVLARRAHAHDRRRRLVQG